MSFERFRSVQVVAILMVTVCAAPAAAHHILGIPHYSYNEDYPQTPVLTYMAEAGPYEVKMTSYPGEIEPGDQATLHVYVREATTGDLYDGTVSLTVRRQRLVATDPVIYGPSEARLDERIYKFHPQFAEEAKYVAELSFASGAAHWVIDMPMVVGEPAPPWVLAGWVAGGTLILGVLLRALTIKRRRRQRAVATTAVAATR